MATIARLRAVLEQAGFEPRRINSCLDALRQTGFVEHGRPGRDGVGSAAIDVGTAAHLLLMLSLDQGDALDALRRAGAAGRFRLRAIDEPHGLNGTVRRWLPDNDLMLLDAIVGDVRAAAGGMADHEPSSWVISDFEACQARPERMVYVADAHEIGEPRIRRETFIPGQLIAAVAALYDEPRWQFEPDEWVHARELAGL